MTPRERVVFKMMLLLVFILLGMDASLLATAFAASSSASSATTAHYPLHRRNAFHPVTSIPGKLYFQSQHAVVIPTRTNSGATRGRLQHLHLLRGGGGGGVMEGLAACKWTSSPQVLFNNTLLALALLTALAKILQRVDQAQQAAATASKHKANGTTALVVASKPDSIKSLQLRFLPVFWLLRCSDWLQGPYFYEVYASKVFNGVPATMRLVSQLFLTGFASTALFGPSVGRAADQYGRKKATLAFCLVYAAGAWSTKSPLLTILLLGRVLSGIGTSLLFSAPESWLVGEAQKSGDDPDGKYLGETFGLAYAGDSIVAIAAGQMAGWTASLKGPTGPFELSTAFLLVAGLSAALMWRENKASSASPSTKQDGDSNSNSKKSSIREAIQVVARDPQIMLVGAVQSLFEAAMYIFVLQWPPAVAKAIGKSYGSAAMTPYGTIFSCFMACCLLGSTLFGQLAKMAVKTENFTAVMLSVATIAMSAATWIVAKSGGTLATTATTSSLAALVAAFFVFEACVGMYFPSIGTLRSKYVPDSHRSIIMNLFGIPLNVLVVSVFLSIDKLGVVGALGISTGALGIAAACMFRLLKAIDKKK
jgi:MFS transporter, MFS domain-containing protein family, molybdate-anion transporter